VRIARRLLPLLVAAAAAGAQPFVDAAPPSPSLEARLAEIQRRVQAALVYPESARLRGVAGETRVAFEILSDGTPGAVDVVESSGSLALDRAARRAVQHAGALPRVLGRVNVPVRFALLARP